MPTSPLADLINQESLSMPPSQQKTPVRGTGGGLSDMIPATVEGELPASLSEGEFVVDAETVSMLGDGSSEAGARILSKLVEQIKTAKNKSSDDGKQSKSMMEILQGGS